MWTWSQCGLGLGFDFVSPQGHDLRVWLCVSSGPFSQWRPWWCPESRDESVHGAGPQHAADCRGKHTHAHKNSLNRFHCFLCDMLRCVRSTMLIRCGSEEHSSDDNSSNERFCWAQFLWWVVLMSGSQSGSLEHVRSVWSESIRAPSWSKIKLQKLIKKKRRSNYLNL